MKKLQTKYKPKYIITEVELSARFKKITMSEDDEPDESRYRSQVGLSTSMVRGHFLYLYLSAADRN